MDKATTPFIVSVLFMVRCLIPLLFLFGLSYLLKRLGLIQDAPAPPAESQNGNNEDNQNDSGGGGLAKSNA